MLVYLVKNLYKFRDDNEPFSTKAFTDKLTALNYMQDMTMSFIGKRLISPKLEEYELVTDEFMQQIIQPKEQHEINTNSNVQ